MLSILQFKVLELVFGLVKILKTGTLKIIAVIVFLLNSLILLWVTSLKIQMD